MSNVKPPARRNYTLKHLAEFTRHPAVDEHVWLSTQSRSILGSLPSPAFAFGRSGIISLFNHAAEQLLGYAERDIVGVVSVDQIFLASQVRSCADRLAETKDLSIPDGISLFAALSELGADASLEWQLVRCDGVLVSANVTFSSLRGVDEELGGFLCVVSEPVAHANVDEVLRPLHEAMENAIEGMARLDKNGCYVSANHAYAKTLGRTIDELVGAHWKIAVLPDDHDLVIAAATVMRETGRGEAEVRGVRKDGSIFYKDFVLIKAPSEDGSYNGVYSFMKDITARKMAEEALVKSEARLLEAQSVAKVGSWEFDIATQKITWSAEFFRIVNRDPTLGEPSYGEHYAIFHHDDVPKLMLLESRAMALGEEYRIDLRSPDDGTEMKCYHAVGRVVRDASGNIVRLIGTFSDITERFLSEEKFRILFEQSTGALILLDENGIVDCNQATIQLLCCTDKAQVLWTHPAVFSPEYQPDGRRSDEKSVEMDAIAREQGFHRFEWQHRKLTGEVFPVEVTLNPVTLAGRPALLVVWHDLTEHKLAEQQLKDYAIVLEFQKQQLETANSELDALATSDYLTGLKNHRAFQERIAIELARSVRYGSPLSMILMDVDHFKQYNDTFGHPEGDSVLRRVAQAIGSCCRVTDLVARYGGEEFAVILPDTPIAGAEVIAERIRLAVANTKWHQRAVTISLGVSTLSIANETVQAIILAADKSLYKSKADGRNRVTSTGNGEFQGCHGLLTQ